MSGVSHLLLKLASLRNDSMEEFHPHDMEHGVLVNGNRLDL